MSEFFDLVPSQHDKFNLGLIIEIVKKLVEKDVITPEEYDKMLENAKKFRDGDKDNK